MIAVIKHAWNLSFKSARRLQKNLSTQLQFAVIQQPILNLIAVDVSYTRWDRQGYGVLGFFELNYDNAKRQYTIQHEELLTRTAKVDFPYVPGYLSFREIPVLMPLFEQVKSRPDLLLVDGVGIAHPRRLGLATHLGLIFDLPSIGCAKSKLIGTFAEPNQQKGDFEMLYDQDQIVGSVLRSKDRVKPLFISPGYKIDVTSAREIVLSLCSRYRLPDPIRRVDAVSKSIRKINHNQF